MSGADWREPEPLYEVFEGLAYPEGFLPPILRDAVREAQAFVQAPMALVAASALSVSAIGIYRPVRSRHKPAKVGPGGAVAESA